MHRHDPAREVLTQAIVRYAIDRVRLDPPPLDHPRSAAELRAMAGRTITPGGLGGLEALRIFGDVLAPACLSVDHPRYLSFVPAAPTEASILFDLVVGASSIYGGSWLEASRGGVRRERGAALDRRRRRAAGRRRWRVRQRWDGRQPQRPARRPLEVARRRRWRPRPHAGTGRRLDRRALVGRARRRGRWTPTSCACPPTSAASSPRPALDRTLAELADRRAGPGRSPSSRRPAPRTPVSSTTCAPRPRRPSGSARGSTSTVPTAGPG